MQYDFDQQLARAEMLEGYNAGKTFVRRYDQVWMSDAYCKFLLG